MPSPAPNIALVPRDGSDIFVRASEDAVAEEAVMAGGTLAERTADRDEPDTGGVGTPVAAAIAFFTHMFVVDDYGAGLGHRARENRIDVVQRLRGELGLSSGQSHRTTPDSVLMSLVSI